MNYEISKLNLGCGFNKIQGYWNVDVDDLCQPDEVVDLEKTPWPWPDHQFDRIHAFHSLEHLGQKTEVWLNVMKELWRVSKNNGIIEMAFPHHLHENFFHDPTHVRVITPIGIAMFDQQRNMDDYSRGGAESKLGLRCGIDFQIQNIGYDLNEPWRSAYANRQISKEQLEFEMNTRTNVCIQVTILLKVIKPPRGEFFLRSLQRKQNSPDSDQLLNLTP